MKFCKLENSLKNPQAIEGANCHTVKPFLFFLLTLICPTLVSGHFWNIEHTFFWLSVLGGGRFMRFNTILGLFRGGDCFKRWGFEWLICWVGLCKVGRGGWLKESNIVRFMTGNQSLSIFTAAGPAFIQKFIEVFQNSTKTWNNIKCVKKRAYTLI